MAEAGDTDLANLARRLNLTIPSRVPGLLADCNPGRLGVPGGAAQELNPQINRLVLPIPGHALATVR